MIISIGIFLAGLGLFLFSQESNKIIILSTEDMGVEKKVAPAEPVVPKIVDIAPQKPLINPPEKIKAIYATSWSAGSEKKLKYLIDLIKETELNAIVIDIKDYSGYVAYNTDLELPKKYDAIEIRIPKLNQLVKRFHDEGIYVIGRISVFQDQRLALARPDLALYSSSTGGLWKDFKGLMWMDTASTEVWQYNADIAKEILARGVDEANFDYIRFASDGDMDDIKYPFWDEKTLKTKIVRQFLEYLHAQIPDGKISGDLFGLVTINKDGLGIGQHLEFALPYLDAIAPMTYPSHYFTGFIGFEKPAEYPYEVIKYSMDTAVKRIEEFKVYASTTPIRAKLRPWFQDFDLGADYDAVKVKAQIQAWEDSVAGHPDLDGGWMLWNASNIYTKDALKPETP
ncbi:MAG: putative glycoside hydrolase [bacterium]|nr:putative glycoside hydrolase [bacterium]